MSFAIPHPLFKTQVKLNQPELLTVSSNSHCPHVICRDIGK